MRVAPSGRSFGREPTHPARFDERTSGQQDERSCPAGRRRLGAGRKRGTWGTVAFPKARAVRRLGKRPPPRGGWRAKRDWGSTPRGTGRARLMRGAGGARSTPPGASRLPPLGGGRLMRGAGARRRGDAHASGPVRQLPPFFSFLPSPFSPKGFDPAFRFAYTPLPPPRTRADSRFRRPADAANAPPTGTRHAPSPPCRHRRRDRRRRR